MKSQAALEFIMTYGWTIMVVAVAIVAISYHGVLEYNKTIANKCSLPPGLECMDVAAYTFPPNYAELYIVLRNSLGVNIGGVRVTTDVCPNTYSFNYLPYWLRVGGIDTVAWTQQTVGGDCYFSGVGNRVTGHFNVTYKNLETGINHTVRGTFTTLSEIYPFW